MFALLQNIILFARTIFIDLRLIALVMALWLGIIVSIMIEIGIFSNTTFMSCGPRPDLTFMHVPIDTYYKYNMLIVMIVMHTFVTDVIADSLSPHVLNVVQDTRNRFIPHKPSTYFSITTIWAIYCSISQLFMVFIAFAQFDLLLARLASDLLANLFTTSLYLHGKSYDPVQYHRESDPHLHDNMQMMNFTHDEEDTHTADDFLITSPKGKQHDKSPLLSQITSTKQMTQAQEETSSLTSSH
jgi:hypothetical protein